MSIQDLHQEGTDKVLDHMVKHPLPERPPIDNSIDFNETVYQTQLFVSDNYFEICGIVVILLLVLAARRILQMPDLSRWTKPLAWVGCCALIITVTTVFLGPKGGAWAGAVILVTAFNRWRSGRRPE